MKEYVLNCPNALRNPKRGLIISTQFFYDTLEEALAHKEMCDIWDRDHGREPRTYIEELEKND